MNRTAAYRRARKLLSEHSRAILAADALSAVMAILFLLLLGVGGLLVGLLTTRGEVLLPANRFADVPRWVQSQLPVERTGGTVIRDGGIYPIIAANIASKNPAHAWFARRLAGLQARFAPLRTNRGALLSLMSFLLGLILAIALVDRARRSLISESVSEVVTSIRHQIHRQMYRRGESALPTEGTGPVVDLFTREVNEVRDGLLADLDMWLAAPVLAAGLLLIALFVSIPATIFLLSLSGVVWFASRPLNRSARTEAEIASRASAVQLSLLQEDLSMLRTVRVYGMEGVDKRRFDEHLEHFRAADEGRIRTQGRSNPTALLIGGVAGVLALGLIGFLVLEDRPDRISPAAAAVLLAALLGLWRPARDWFKMRRSMLVAGRAAVGIFEYLTQRPELQQSVGAQFLPPLRDRITFENVSLEDGAGRPLLVGVSAEVPARSRTAILGLDEEAKLALVCLLPRLIDPKSGRVRMDGLDLRDVTLESIRAQVATVLQSDLVFTDSVLANIGLGDPSYGLPRIIEAAKVAHAHHFIQDLPHGYETVIGPLGHYLRPDEQYRIALARAFLHDPSIVIVEEPNVPLDDDTKHLIDDTIARLAPGRTLIFLPHRLSTIRNCEQVIVLHNGRVESAGSPREVHLASKLYRHIQYVEFNQFATGEIEAGQMGG